RRARAHRAHPQPGRRSRRARRRAAGHPPKLALSAAEEIQRPLAGLTSRFQTAPSLPQTIEKPPNDRIAVIATVSGCSLCGTSIALATFTRRQALLSNRSTAEREDIHGLQKPCVHRNRISHYVWSRYRIR